MSSDIKNCNCNRIVCILHGCQDFETEEVIQKPPIGIKPQYVWIEERISDINKAIARYDNVSMAHPVSWDEEVLSLTHALQVKQLQGLSGLNTF